MIYTVQTATMEVMLAIKQLDFKRVAELLSKSPPKENGDSTGGDTGYQISLIRSAMNTGSIEMLEMVLENARKQNQKGGTQETQNGDTTSIQTNGADGNNKTQTTTKDNFIQTAFNNWKRKISAHQRNPANQNTTETPSAAGGSKDINNNSVSETIPEETTGAEEQGAGEGGEKRTTPRQKKSCPTGLDEKYYIYQNRRHCTWYDEENPDDVADFEKHKKQAYMDEVSKAEELLKTMKTKRKRKHSVGKSLYGKNG